MCFSLLGSFIESTIGEIIVLIPLCAHDIKYFIIAFFVSMYTELLLTSLRKITKFV